MCRLRGPSSAIARHIGGTLNVLHGQFEADKAIPTACPDPEMSLAKSSEQVPHAQPRLQLSMYDVWYGTTFAVPQFAVSGGGSHVLGPADNTTVRRTAAGGWHVRLSWHALQHHGSIATDSHSLRRTNGWVRTDLKSSLSPRCPTRSCLRHVRESGSASEQQSHSVTGARVRAIAIIAISNES